MLLVLLLFVAAHSAVVVTRRAVLLGAPAVAADTPAESIRKAASSIPGLGPPDVLYPRVAFLGRWILAREVASVRTPRGEEMGSAAARFVLEAAVPGRRLEYPVRFLEYGDGESVVFDRGFAAEKAAAASGNAFSGGTATWDPSNPNVLTIERNGGILETKVTKRSYEAPSPTAFGSSEYVRLALSPPGGFLGGVPDILAQRTQTRWRWDDGADTIDGLELVTTYDPTSRLRRADENNEAIIIAKSRLTLLRRRGPSS